MYPTISTVCLYTLMYVIPFHAGSAQGFFFSSNHLKDDLKSAIQINFN